jgi:hypothetical protein
MLMKKTRVNNDCFDAWLIEVLDAVLCFGYAPGLGPSFQADMRGFLRFPLFLRIAPNSWRTAEPCARLVRNYRRRSACEIIVGLP